MLCECNGFARPAEEDPPAPWFSALALSARYRFDCPRASFLTFFFSDPRGVVRFALGAAFLRAARLTSLRAALSVIDFVFAIDPFSESVGVPFKPSFGLSGRRSQPLQLREFLHQLFHSES